MDRFRREPTKFHYKKRWPSNGWTKKRNQITCNKEERISPPSYNKRPDVERFRWRLKVYANSINWKRSQNGFFGNLITLALFISPGVCAFFLYPCQMQAGWTWYSRWNRIWEWIFSNERSIIDSRLWILEVFFIIQSQLFKNFYRR